MMKKQLIAGLMIAMLLFASLAAAEAAPSFEELGAFEWTFCSGAGAWSTSIWIAPDGTFTGEYHDSEMGDAGESYPNGTVYGCLFHGQLSMGEQESEYAWNVHVDEVELDEGQLDEAIEDGVRYVTVDPYGLKAGNDMLLYLPGTPVEDLPEGFLLWAHLLDGSATELPYYGLYDAAEDTGFIGEAIVEDA